MPAVDVWCRVTILGPDGAELDCCVLEGPGVPDLGAVDQMGRLALLAGRLGGSIVLTELSPTLRSLLELAGLRVDVGGQAERREEPFGVQESQEEGHTGDLPP
jgi:hypothetical protein